MIKTAILIPCYNEAKTIEKVVKDFLPYGSVFVYDNNSTDGTAAIAENAGATVRHEYKQGKGNVIRRMFREIDAECYVLVDGDDTYPAASAQEMISEVLDNKYDMVVGDRLSSTYFEQNKRPFHGFGNKLVRKLINMFFKSEIKDIMTGYRAFSYQFVKTFPVLSRGFEIETEMSIHAIDKNMAVANVIVDYKDRPDGSVSKLNTYSDGLKVLRTIARMFRTYKPMPFYGAISIVLLLIAIVLFIPIMVEYANTGLVPRFPTLITCGFIVIAAILSFFSGLILETMRQKDRQDFEINLIRIHNSQN